MLLVNPAQSTFLLEDGIYAFRVKDVLKTTSKNGRPYFQMTYEVIDGPETGKELKFQNIFLDEGNGPKKDGLKYFFQFLSAITGEELEGGAQFDLEEGAERGFIDREFCAGVSTRDYKKSDGTSGKANQITFIDWRLYHPIDSYTALKAAWDMEHGTVEDAGDETDSDPLGDLDDHPF